MEVMRPLMNVLVMEDVPDWKSLLTEGGGGGGKGGDDRGGEDSSFGRVSVSAAPDVAAKVVVVLELTGGD
jgi:hypothetical protein